MAKTASSKKSTIPDFEKALTELEELVEHMEEGNISLEDSLKYFERGIILTRSCQDALKSAEQKVQILMKENERTDIQPFENTSHSSSDD